MKQIFSIFFVFFKIGAFTFGGGYSMIPLIHKEIVENKKWITEDEMFDLYAVSQSTPGVIAVNTATFIGYKAGKTLGAVFATLGVILPSITFISIISFFLDTFQNIKYVTYALNGIRVGTIVLIINATIKLYELNEKTKLNYCIAIIAFIIASFTKLNSILILLAGIVFGITLEIILRKSTLKKGTDEKN